MAILGSSLLGSSFLGGPERILQVAWGADLTDLTGTTWAWTDVTADVRVQPGFSWRLGRSDESSTSNPAELTVVLDNTSGDYSLGGRSANYPHVRRNVPVRLLIDPGDVDGARVSFLGFATGWTPSWDCLDGTIPVVTLTASGNLRRLAQGAEPVISPIKRYLTALENVVAYWPCEVGEHASSLPPEFGGGAITWAGEADLASYSRFASSNPLPTTNASGLFRAQVSPYSVPSVNTQSVRMLFGLPETANAPANNSVLVSLIMTGGSTSRIDLIYGTGSVLTFKAYDRFGATICTDAATFGIDDKPGWLSLEMAQSGGLVFVAIKFLGLGSASFGSSAGASGSGTLGIVSEVWVDAFQTVTGVGFGHLAVMTVGSAVDPLTDAYVQLNAYDGEVITGGGRLTRVCSENAIALTPYGATPETGTFNDYAGPQPIATVLDILHACEDVEQGVLWDGLTPGLAYTTRRRHENADVALTVDASAGQLAPPFEPVDDDQRTRNRWTVTRSGGAEFTVEDTTGPMGTQVVGVYNDSKTINVYQDRGARDLADWLVHAGTIEGYRYPTLTIDLVAHPELAGAVVDLFPGARVDVVGMLGVLSSVSQDSVSLTVEGISHELTESTWVAALSCSPFDVWRVDVVAAETGDTSDSAVRLDGDDTVVGTDALAGATSLVVNTPTGALWTSAADDYPLALDVGGVEVTATACTAAGGGSGTMGKLTDGVSSSSSSANKTVVSPFTAANTGTVTASHARLWVDSGTAPNVSMCIYADSAGVPGALLGSSSTVTLSNTAEALIDFTWSSGPSITSSLPYHVGFSWPDPGTNNVFWSRDATAASASQNSSNLANPFGVATALSGPIDAYVDITAGSATSQTFTVAALPVDRVAGTTVALWNPPVLGL